MQTQLSVRVEHLITFSANENNQQNELPSMPKIQYLQSRFKFFSVEILELS